MDLNFKDFSFANFQFESYSLLCFALLGILFLLFEYFPGRNYFYSLQNLTRFIDKHLIRHLLVGNENKKSSRKRVIFISIIWVLLALALANPRWDYEKVETFESNANVVILLDISKSMDAADEKPSRLERAKQEITDIVKRSDNLNIGLMVFANQAHIISPVTDDKGAILYLLPSVTTDLVGVQGSSISAGIKAADLLLKPLAGGTNYILVMSDGEFEDNTSIKQLSSSLKNSKLITFGIGSEKGAPVPDESGKLIKEDGKPVMSHLQKENLIALSGLDNYIQISYMDDDTQKVARILSNQLNKTKARTKDVTIWHDRFYIPLILAAIMLLPFFRKGMIFPIVLLFFSSGVMAMPEQPVAESNYGADRSVLEKVIDVMFKNNNQIAKDMFQDRDFAGAEEKFSGDYNKGVARFRAGDYEAAENYFSRDENDMNAKYNSGNAQMLQGKLPQAIETYEAVLKKEPDNENAKFNLELAKRMQANQEKEQKKQDKSKKDQNKDQDKDQKQDPDKNSSDKDNSSDPKNGKDKLGKDKTDKNRVPDSKEQPQNPDKNSGQKGQNNKEQESDGKTNKKELDIQAKNILGKISSDPAKLMKARFEYEESDNPQSSQGQKNPRPW